MQRDLADLTCQINASYQDIALEESQLEAYKCHKTYNSKLWIKIVDTDRNEIAASGIAEIDSKIKEGVLEWIQVLPGYRGKGIGRCGVQELLCRLRPAARFATVSGKVNSLANPQKLYRKCGFTGEDIWHVLRRKSEENA